jgi:hypothetical protein
VRSSLRHGMIADTNGRNEESGESSLQPGSAQVDRIALARPMNSPANRPQNSQQNAVEKPVRRLSTILS